MAVPRKGRPLEGVLQRLASITGVEETADDIISTLRFEKAITKDDQSATQDVYDRLATYSDLSDPTEPEYTLFRDDRDGMPRRIIFDSVTISTETANIQLVGREEPFRALRTHEFALGFDSADLVLEEVVQLRDDAIEELADINDRIDPLDTDVRVVSGLGDTVYHTLLARPDILETGSGPLDRAFVREYSGDLCISPRYERLVEAVLGTGALQDIDFTYPADGVEEESAIAETGLGVYVTVTGSTARDNGLVLGEKLFPSETVLLTNESEVSTDAAVVRDLLTSELDAPTQ